MVRAVFQVPNMQRVAGKPGSVGRVAVEKFGGDFDMYIDQLGLPGYWPTSLVVSVRPCSFACSGPGMLTAESDRAA